MKKAIELAVKTTKDISFNSAEFKEIQKQIDKSIRDALADKYDDYTYQCNCLKTYDEKEGHMILVKVYFISKSLQEDELEMNFLLNEPTPKVNEKGEKTDKKVEEYELQIRNISARITKIKEEIDVELGKTLTEKVIEKLNSLTDELKQRENELERKQKQLEYYKAEFLI